MSANTSFHYFGLASFVLDGYFYSRKSAFNAKLERLSCSPAGRRDELSRSPDGDEG